MAKWINAMVRSYIYIEDISCENAHLIWEWWEYISTIRL